MKFVKTFFLHTLHISEKMLFSAYKKKTDIIEEDKRVQLNAFKIMTKKKELRTYSSFPSNRESL